MTADVPLSQLDEFRWNWDRAYKIVAAGGHCLAQRRDDGRTLTVTGYSSGRTDGTAPVLRDRTRRLDDELSAALAEIAHRTDDGQITAAEAAHERVEALERHLGEMQLLRELHFPGSAEGSQPLAQLKYWRTTMRQLLADGIAHQEASAHPRERGQIGIYRKLARELHIEV